MLTDFCDRCSCPCHWPQSWPERMADWFMAPADWASDQPTVLRRLAAVLLVAPVVSLFVFPVIALLIVEEIRVRW